MQEASLYSNGLPVGAPASGRSTTTAPGFATAPRSGALRRDTLGTYHEPPSISAASVGTLWQGAEARPAVEAAPREFGIGASLLEAYRGSHASASSASRGKLGERIIVGATIDGDNSADEFREHAMAAAGKP